VAILFSGIAPGLALLIYFYLKDKYEPEPLFLVFRTFIIGAVLVFPVAIIENLLETKNPVESDIFNTFFSTGMLEEVFKWSMLYFFAYRNAEFDEPFDGIVYGASISLGFATAENIMFLMSNGVEYAFYRALLPVSSHALFGVIMGYYVSRAKFTKGLKWVWMILSIILPSFLHGTFDYILLNQKSWIIAMISYMTFLWWFGLKKVQMAESLSKIHFQNELYSSNMNRKLNTIIPSIVNKTS
jgi:protease PrsW